MMEGPNVGILISVIFSQSELSVQKSRKSQRKEIEWECRD